MKYLRGVAFCFSTLALYLGLPLLGWGVAHLGDYFSAGPRLAYAAVVAAFGLAVGVQAIDAPEGIRGSRGEEGKLVRRQSVVRIGLIVLLYATLVFLPFADRHNLGVWSEAPIPRWLGAVLCGLGYAFVFLSGLALGRQYSQEVTIQKDHQLITTGIFHTIRHPRYLGLMLAAVGLALLFRSWIGLTASVGLTLVLLGRIRDEEALLQKEFGQEWEAYCKTTWRLVPYLY